MRELSAGDDAVLLDFSRVPEADAATRAAAVLTAAARTGDLVVDDIVPTAQTVLVQASPGTGLDVLAVRRALRSAEREHALWGTGVSSPGGPEAVIIPVHYDGADLAEVAELTRASIDDVIAAHHAISWRVQFMGFAPGFGYLVPGPDSPPSATALLAPVGRRAESRPAVPTGAVAIAAGYSAVYPRISPGGWFLLGHTDIPMWDDAAHPPALLAAGATVRFTCAD